MAAGLRWHDDCADDGRHALAGNGAEEFLGVAEGDPPAEVSAIGDSNPFDIFADRRMLTDSPGNRFPQDHVRSPIETNNAFIPKRSSKSLSDHANFSSSTPSKSQVAGNCKGLLLKQNEWWKYSMWGLLNIYRKRAQGTTIYRLTQCRDVSACASARRHWWTTPDPGASRETFPGPEPGGRAPGSGLVALHKASGRMEGIGLQTSENTSVLRPHQAAGWGSRGRAI